MLSGVTFSACEIAGTAVFRIVVSSDSMKNATATSHGKSFLLEADGAAGIEGELAELTGLMAMESKNHLTDESRNLLKGAVTPQIRPLLVWTGFAGRLVPTAGNQLYKSAPRGLSFRSFLATMKRP